MYTDLKSGDYPAWNFYTRQQKRALMTQFLYSNDTSAKSAYRIREIYPDEPEAPTGFSACIQKVCRVSSGRPFDIVELIRNARIRTDRNLPFIRRNISESEPGADQLRSVLGTFMAGIAHHFNNLFMAFQGNVSLVLMASDASHPDLSRLLRIEKLIQGESMLTNDLLGFAWGRGCQISNRRQTLLLKEILAISDYICPLKGSPRLDGLSFPFPDLPVHFLRRLTGSITCILTRILSEIHGHTRVILSHTKADHQDHERLKQLQSYVQTGFAFLLNLFNFTGYRVHDVKHRVYLTQLAETALDIHFRSYPDIPFHAAFECDLRAIKANRRQIEDVLQKLFDNAADALPNGGEIALCARNITRHAIDEKDWDTPPGNYVIINFEDTGQGIDEPILKRIYDPFFTTKNVNCHRGLGLSSASGILRSLGGYISAGSGPQRGTVFKIYLPADGKRGQNRSGSRSVSRNRVIHLGINKKQGILKYH